VAPPNPELEQRRGMQPLLELELAAVLEALGLEPVEERGST
jgi:hypothetical protein